MKYHHVVFSALLLGTGFNVIFNSQNGQQLWRGLASEQVEKDQEVELTLENFSAHIGQMDERADEIVELHEKIKVALEKKDLKGLISARDKDILSLEKKIKAHKKDHKKVSDFLSEKVKNDQEEKILGDLKNISSILDKVQGIELEVLAGDLKDSITSALEDKAIAQNEIIENLSESVCKQNRELSSLTTKIEDLLEKQEKVFAKVEENEKEQTPNESLGMDPNLLFQAFASAFAMPPQNFFSAPQYTGLASESNPMGLDMNFLMMTQMLSQSSGFGPRSNIHYAPVYNQQRTYNGMPQMFNHDSFNREGMLPPKGALFPGFNFSRGNGLVEEIQL